MELDTCKYYYMMIDGYSWMVPVPRVRSSTYRHLLLDVIDWNKQ